jgi:hypothetical protein
MSGSIHITSRNFKGLTKTEIDEQFIDSTSELSQWSEKLQIKKTTVKDRRQLKNQNKVVRKDTLNSTEDLF